MRWNRPGLTVSRVSCGRSIWAWWDGIVKRAEGAAPPRPKEAVIFEAGGVAALLRIAQRLGVIELIDEVIPKRDQGPSVVRYMVLAALNRALAPCSKTCGIFSRPSS